MGDRPGPIMYACLEGWEPYCGICAACGADLVDTGYGCRKQPEQPREETCVQRWRENHQWGYARPAALKRDGHQCVRDGCDVGGWKLQGLLVEVHHVLPRRGDTATLSCLHHLDNLETLCHPHHVEVTRERPRHYEQPACGGR